MFAMKIWKNKSDKGTRILGNKIYFESIIYKIKFK